MTDSLLRRTQHSLAPAQRRDLELIRDLCAEDPVANVVPMSHVEAALSSGSMPVGLWTVRRRSGWAREIAGAVWAGSNVSAVLPEVDPESAEERMAELAAALVGRVAKPAAIVGPAAITLDLWGRVEPWWGPAREVRPRQVSMRIDGAARHVGALDVADLQLEAVRTAGDGDYEALLPACVHMFIGEVGYDPMRHGRAAYEDRLHRLVRAGRAYVQFGIAEGRRQVVFKAEVGALAGGVAQLQGVWVHPHLRGRGLARAGLAAVVEAVRADTAPTVSLYVNDFNVSALATYDAVGFTRVGTFATIMF
ncbi:MAG: GNAT family N-acetyltransferase [Demequina sp.]